MDVFAHGLMDGWRRDQTTRRILCPPTVARSDYTMVSGINSCRVSLWRLARLQFDQSSPASLRVVEEGANESVDHGNTRNLEEHLVGFVNLGEEIPENNSHVKTFHWGGGG